MSNIIFVTGTDTGVGKTFFTRLLVAGLRNRGVMVGVAKPVETGCELVDGELQAADALALWRASGKRQLLEDVVPYRFCTPVAPNVAAAVQGSVIDFDFLCQHLQRLSAESDFLIVEGAGGLLVPLDDKRTFADLARQLEMRVILVVGSRLGCINHASLTLEVLKRREIAVLGYVLNNLCDNVEDQSLSSNRDSLRKAAAKYAVEELAQLAWMAQQSDLDHLFETLGSELNVCS